MKRIKEKQTFSPNFYTTLSVSQVSQGELLELVKKRIKILRMVEDGVKDENLVGLSKEEDNISHFLCRLVCSQIQWVSNWFVNAEARYFKSRLGDATKFIRFRNVEVVDDTVWIKRESEFDENASVNVGRIKVHFSKISEVVGRRQVEVKDGYCDLSHVDVLLTNEFKNSLRKKMRLKGDSRLLKICKDLFVDTPAPRSSVLREFDTEDKKYYPPCITSILEHFSVQKHIKFNDRQALTLFLKDVGMGVQECSDFFFSMFKIPRVDFDKQYSYNIRHNYGLEGKKANYSCFSCQKMAYNKNSTNLSGCPFVENKKYVEKYVEEYCGERGVDLEDIFKETSPVSRCTRLLEKLTKEEYEKTVTTPIKYFVTYKKSNKK